jgi:hypothetical protein
MANIKEKMMNSQRIRETFEKGQGVLRMVPCWVPRTFSQPGQRLHLHPDDYFALGTRRGAIKERWFSSTISASNGPLAPWDEGMSYVSTDNGQAEDHRLLFKDVIAELSADLIGAELWQQYGSWPMYSKFFDYRLPLFHHLHPDDTAARRVGRLGKPEAYYFPIQLNNYPGEFPLTYFGFNPGVTKEMVKQRLADYEARDTRLTELSHAYRLTLGTGWYIPAGVVHAPGSLLTYEPQWNSDVASVFENVASGEALARQSLVSDVPQDQIDNVDYLISLMDWETNLDPLFQQKFFRPPLDIPQSEAGFTEKWITYATPYFSAKELSVAPGAKVTVKDGAAYGCIIIQGHGTFGCFEAEAAGLLRYGQASADEYFVSESAARAGIQISNHSHCEPLVVLKHFGPNHPDAPKTLSA